MTKIDNLLCDLTDYGVLKVSGGEAVKLLQGQFTCDVEKLKAGESKLCAHCNPQGRIVSLFYLANWHDAYYLVMPRGLVAITISALKKYAPFYKVSLLDVSDQFSLLGYKGRLMPLSPEALSLAYSPTRSLVLTEEVNKTTLWHQLAPTARMITSNEWKHWDIEEGIPTIYPETSSQFLPHEINLPELGAISFDKGCYIGQEIIARMHYRGKLKTHLSAVTLQSDTPLARGSDIPLPVGTIVDLCQEEPHHYYALIITRK